MADHGNEPFLPPVVVIGAGPAGLYAGFRLGLRGMRPVIIDSLGAPGGQLSALYPDGVIHDAPGVEAKEARLLAARLAEQIAPFRPLFLLGRRATALWGTLDSGFNVETDTGETVTGGAVIFAGGAGAIRPRRLEAEGIEGVAADDLLYEPGPAPSGRRVAVIGDGRDAVDAALEAAQRAAHVTLIHALPLRSDAARLDRLRAVGGRALSIEQGIVERVRAREGRLSGVELGGSHGRRSIDVDMLLVRAGLEFAGTDLTGLRPLADLTTGETEERGVFIAGDALDMSGRLPGLANGFAEAARAAEAASRRLAPNAPRTLPHAYLSPALSARLSVA